MSSRIFPVVDAFGVGTNGHADSGTNTQLFSVTSLSPITLRGIYPATSTALLNFYVEGMSSEVLDANGDQVDLATQPNPVVLDGAGTYFVTFSDGDAILDLIR